MKKRVFLGVLLTLAAMLVACGGGSDPTVIADPTNESEPTVAADPTNDSEPTTTSDPTSVSNSEEGSGAEATVRTYFDALSEGNAALMASAFVPEISEGMTETELPPINITNLVLEVDSATSNSAKVLVGCDSDFPVDAHFELRFTVDKRDGKWLISNAEAVNVVRDEGIVVQVLDEDGAPIGGARVTVASAQTEVLSALNTDAEGLATFEGFPEPDNIVVIKDGYTPSTGWSFRLGEPWKVTLQSIDSLNERGEDVVLAAVDPPFITIPQGGSASVTATLFSIERPARVALTLRGRGETSVEFARVSDPEEVTLPESGEAHVNLSLSTLAGLALGVYDVDITPQVLEDFRVQGLGEVYSSGGQQLVIKVVARE